MIASRLILVTSLLLSLDAQVLVDVGAETTYVRDLNRSRARSSKASKAPKIQKALKAPKLLSPTKSAKGPKGLKGGIPETSSKNKTQKAPKGGKTKSAKIGKSKKTRAPTLSPTNAPTNAPPTNAPTNAPIACSPDPLDFSKTVGMQVVKVGSVPTASTEAWTYNMMVADNFDDKVYFMDQIMGKIYSYDPVSGGDPVLIFDMATSAIPDGLTLDYNGPTTAATQRVHMMTKGKLADEVYVVFSSSTLPTGYSKADAQLPPAGAYPGYMCATGSSTFVRDIYRIGVQPACMENEFVTYTIYNVFYKFTLSGGALTSPKPFFILENQLQSGHLGGGIATVDNGKVLWSVGDCLYYGSDGRYAPQVDTMHCGKILLINPDSPGTYNIVAKGVRNSQQMRIINYKDKDPNAVDTKDLLVFMDIGGVTAEEVNGIYLDQILNTGKIDNFGWGRSQMDGKAREGTCYIAPGNMGILGTEPPSEAIAPQPESGYVQPWIQFGRSATDFFYGISGFAVAFKSFNQLDLIWTEFNTGLIMGTMEEFLPDRVTKGYKIKLYDADGTYLENGGNDLVKKELGEVGYYRGDPRLFHYPDGTAGLFIERTGVFYKLTEIAI